MKKSVIYRTLQVGSAVALYATVSVWASANHVGSISNLLNQIDSLLVILAIAVALPYFCFKALGKMYTPPASLSDDQPSKTSTLGEDELQVKQNMLYRGTPYKPIEQPVSASSNLSDRKIDEVRSQQPEIKYRGVSVVAKEDTSSNQASAPFSEERNSQKTAKPKERIKYRGSYVD